MKKLVFVPLLFIALQNFAVVKYVTQNGAGNFSGTSWGNAINGGGAGLAVLLNSSGQNDTIWVANGIYYTNSATTATATAASTLTSFMLFGSKVYGGFVGTETQINQRNIAANPTILSGNIGQDLVPTNNARHVVRMSGDHPVLDGFIIEDGHADGGIFVGNATFANENIPLHGTGGGLLIYSTPIIIPDTILHTFTLVVNTQLVSKIRNCVFRNNYSSGYSSGAYGGAGAAVFAPWTVKVIASFENCTFKKNTADQNGGAIYATSSKVQPIVYKRNNITYTNLQPDSLNGDLTLRLDSCTIDSNTSLNESAGGIYYDITNSINSVKPRMRSYINYCSFNKNTASTHGCISIKSTNQFKTGVDSLNISNTTFRNNHCLTQSGGTSVLYFRSDDTATLFNYFLYNNLFINNINRHWGSEGVFKSHHQGADRGIIRKCNFINNKTSFGAACLQFDVGNTSPNPQVYKSALVIDSCIFRDNNDTTISSNGNGAFYFRFWNPTDTFSIQNSIISGNRGATGIAHFILNGPLKIVNCTIDSNNSNPTNIVPPISIYGSRCQYSHISNSTFRGNNHLPTTNSAQQCSGAIYYTGGIAGDTTNHIVEKSVFQNNRGGFLGGAIASTGNTGFVILSINKTVFQGNTTGGNGGAIAATTPFNNYGRGRLSISNTLISGNRAQNGGGGIYFDILDGKMMITNSTIASNYVEAIGNFGAGILMAQSGTPDTTRIYNSIIWGNVANGNSHAEVSTMGSGNAKLKLYHSIVKDGFNAQLYAHDDKVSWQDLYMYNPLFVNPISALNTPSINGDYNMQFCSPAINRGDNNQVNSFKDVNDSTRIKQGIVDLGAYETNFNNGIQVPVAYSSYAPACEFNPYQLNSSNVGTASSILWTGPNSFTSNLNNPIITAPNHVGIADSVVVYRLQAFYPNSCSIDDTVAVYVKSGPYINITNNDTALCGSSYSTTFTSSFIPGVTTPNYFWRLDSLNSVLLGNSSTLFVNLTNPVNRKYYLRGTDPNTNCSYVDSVIVELKALPNTSSITGSLSVQTNSVQSYSVVNTNGSSYQWFASGGNQTSGGTTNNIQITWGNNITTGNVKVVETAQNACKGDTVRLNNVIVLPVTLVSFTGKEQNGKSILTWITSTEINNSHFDVERSIDGVHFTRIGSVAGSGNSYITKYYRFIDALTNTKVTYYRLKQIDFNGELTYSNIININSKGLDAATQLVVFPNPANNSIGIDGLLGQAFLYDAMGRMIATITENGLVDISHLTPGMYFVKTTTETVKFVKQQ